MRLHAGMEGAELVIDTVFADLGTLASYSDGATVSYSRRVEIRRRRIYELFNVLEAVGIIQRLPQSHYVFAGVQACQCMLRKLKVGRVVSRCEQ